MSQDKRGRMRTPFHTQVTISAAGQSEGCSGELLDISMNGVFVDTDATVMAVGTPCEVKIVLQAKGSTLTIAAAGKVARLAGQGLAVEFDENLQWWPLFAMYQSKSQKSKNQD